MLLKIVLILLIPIYAFSDPIRTVLEACQSSKVQICEDLKIVEKNINYRGQVLVEKTGMSKPLAVAYWMSDPKFEIKNKNHSLIFKKDKILYSYDF